MIVRVAVEMPLPSLRAIVKRFGWWLIRRPKVRYIVTYGRELPMLRRAPPTDEMPPGA